MGRIVNDDAIILRMSGRICAAIALMFALCLPAFAQNLSVVIDSDMRLFTMMAALNAAGYDVELASQYHPVREAVRKFSQDVDPDLVARLKEFYKRNKRDQ